MDDKVALHVQAQRQDHLRHGKVTLKGPVHTDDERKNIEAKAIKVAGAGNVANQLSVKADK